MRNLNFLEKHKQVLYEKNNKIFVHGGYAGGKSTVVLFKMIQICRHMPGSKFIVGRYTYAALNKDTYEILFNTQDGLLNGLGVFKRNPDVFEFPNGSKLFFTHFDSPKDIIGGSVTGYFIEQAEQIKEDVFKERMRVLISENKYLPIEHKAVSFKRDGFYMPHNQLFLQAMKEINQSTKQQNELVYLSDQYAR